MRDTRQHIIDFEWKYYGGRKGREFETPESQREEINHSRRFERTTQVDRSWRYGSACERRKRVVD
jgi:hypothetical protein